MSGSANTEIVHLKPRTVDLLTEAVRVGVDIEAVFRSGPGKAVSRADRSFGDAEVMAGRLATHTIGTVPMEVSQFAAAHARSAQTMGLDVDSLLQNAAERGITKAMMRQPI